jgi:hypothetical protein
MVLCDVANQNRGRTQTAMNPSNISCSLVLRQRNVFLKIVYEREDDLIRSKQFAKLYI